MPLSEHGDMSITRKQTKPWKQVMGGSLNLNTNGDPCSGFQAPAQGKKEQETKVEGHSRDLG